MKEFEEGLAIMKEIQDAVHDCIQQFRREDMDAKYASLCIHPDTFKKCANDADYIESSDNVDETPISIRGLTLIKTREAPEGMILLVHPDERFGADGFAFSRIESDGDE